MTCPVCGALLLPPSRPGSTCARCPACDIGVHVESGEVPRPHGPRTLSGELRRIVRHHLGVAVPTRYVPQVLSDEQVEDAVEVCAEHLLERIPDAGPQPLFVALVRLLPDAPGALLENLANTVCCCADVLRELPDEVPGAPGW